MQKMVNCALIMGQNVETNKFIRARDVVIDEISFLVTRPELNIQNDTDDSSDWLINIVQKEKTDTVKGPSTSKTGDTSSGAMRPQSQAPENQSKTDTNEINQTTDDMSFGYDRPQSQVPENYQENYENNENITGNKSSGGDRYPGQASEREKVSEKQKRVINESEYKESGQTQRKKAKSENEINIDDNLRRSNRIKDRPQISYNENDCIFDNIIYRAESFASDIPNSFQEIEFRDDREEWEKAVNDELESLWINNT